MTDTLSERSLTILANLVDCYIRDGQPVGSKTLQLQSDLAISSATIRNIMSELEDKGYLASPHASAGRIPTPQGYRLFVDHLLTSQSAADLNPAEFGDIFAKAANQDDLIGNVSSLLSNMTHLVGVVSLPKHEQLILRQVEFVPLADRRVLVILVVNAEQVQNRVIRTDRDYTTAELEQAGQYLTQHFAGQELATVGETLRAKIQQLRTDLHAVITALMDVVNNTCEQEQKPNYIIVGKANLISAGVNDIRQLHALFSAFESERDILHLLNQALDAKGIKIFIGEESGRQVFDDCSVVTSTYSVDNRVVGVLGVIGPRRMPYREVISTVDITARLLGQSLQSV